MNIFLKNWDLKILAVLAALMLWIFVVVIQNSIYVFPDAIEVKALNLDQNVSVLTPMAQVKIRVKTDQQNLNNLKLSDFEAYVDGRNLSIGKHILKVIVTSKNAQATVVSVEPAEIELNLEAITNKEISLETELIGKPANGYLVEEVKLDLEKVTVQGPASLLKLIDKAQAKIILSGNENINFMRSVTPEIKADLLSKIGLGQIADTIKFNPEEIQVKIKISPEKEEKPSDNQVNAQGTQTPSDQNSENTARKSVMADLIFDKDSFKAAVKEVLPRNILVTVEGSSTLLQQLTNQSIKVKLREAGVETGGVYTIKNQDIILADPQLKIIEFTPAKVQIKF